MKSILVLALLISSSAFAEMVSLESAKCSMFGKVKVKVEGLESYGKVGTSTFKSTKLGRSSCKNTVSRLKNSIGTSMVNATVDFNEYTVRRTIRDNDRDDRRNEKSTYECHTFNVKKLSFVFDNHSALKFSNTRQKLVDVDFGSCN